MQPDWMRQQSATTLQALVTIIIDHLFFQTFYVFTNIF
jgi:hypothetical protein